MQGDIRRLVTQPGMAVSAGLGAVILLTLTTAIQVGTGGIAQLGSNLALGSVLGIAVILGYQFPIYIRHNTKIHLISATLLIGSVFLSPWLAGYLAMTSMMLGELTVMTKRGTSLADVVTTVGRWTVAVLLASIVAHLVPVNAAPLERGASFAGAALLLWMVDTLTTPLVVTPISNEHPASVIVGTLREGGAIEFAQYVLGVAGVILALQDRWAILFLLIPTAIVYLASTKRLDSDTLELLENLADTSDLHGTYTVGHSRRVRDLVADILVEMNIGGQEATQIMTASRLHDVGRAALPPDLLISASSLTAGQQMQMESCPELGVELMRGFPDFSRGLEMIRHHHERWDGMGYPDKLAGIEIPFGARIIAVADSFDAMISERPYRRAYTPEQAAQVLIDGAGRQWDPSIVDAFLRSANITFEPEEHDEVVDESRLAVAGAR